MPARDWPTWPDWDVWVRDGCKCVYCGFEATDWTTWFQLDIDHLIPKMMGGGEESSNKVVACRGCNCYKRGFDPREGEPLTAGNDKAALIANARRYIESRKENLRPAFVAMMKEIEALRASA